MTVGRGWDVDLLEGLRPMTLPFRCQLVLLALGEYAYGDHVADPAAFVRRCGTVQRLATRK